LFVDDTLQFFYVVCHLRRCVRVLVLTYYDIFWPLSAFTSKRRCFILAHNIRPKFGTRSVSLPKPSALAECHNLTFGPSLQYNVRTNSAGVKYCVCWCCLIVYTEAWLNMYECWLACVFLCLCRQLAEGGILFCLSECVCVHDHIHNIVQTWYRTNCLWEFQQIYSESAVGDVDEVMRFWGQKVNGKASSQWDHI